MSALPTPYKTALEPVDAHRDAPIDQLLPALFAAYAAIEAPRKNVVNTFHKSKFADLASVMDAVRGPLAANGLLLLQILEPEMGTGQQFLTTRLLHTSGQYIESRTRLVLAKADAQGMGSAITYMRRYTIQCLLGIVPEDDDGNAASHAPLKAAAKVPPKAAAKGPVESVTDKLYARLAQANTLAAVDAISAAPPPLTYGQREVFKRFVAERKAALDKGSK